MTNQKHYKDLGCDTSKVRYFCASFSDVNSELMQQDGSGKKNE